MLMDEIKNYPKPKFWDADAGVNLFNAINTDLGNLILRLDELGVSQKKLVEKQNEETAHLLLQVVEVADAFDRVLENYEVRKEEWDGKTHSLVGNFRTVRMLLSRLLREQNVRQIDALGHVAVAGNHTILETRVDTKIPADTIVEVIEQGYFWKDCILRKAKVVTIVHE